MRDYIKSSNCTIRLKRFRALWQFGWPFIKISNFIWLAQTRRLHTEYVECAHLSWAVPKDPLRLRNCWLVKAAENG